MPYAHYNLETNEWINSPCGRWECVVCGRKNWKYVSDIILDCFGSECRKMTLGISQGIDNEFKGRDRISKGWQSLYKNLWHEGLSIRYYIWIRTYDSRLKETLHIFTNAKIEKEESLFRDIWSKIAGKGYTFDIKVLKPVNEELINVDDLILRTMAIKRELRLKDNSKMYELSHELSKLRNEADAIELKKLKSVTKMIKCEHESAAHPDHRGREEIVCWDVETGKCYTKAHRPLTIKEMLDERLRIDELIPDIG